MTPRSRTKEQVHIGGFLVSFFKLVDCIPTIKRTGPIKGSIRILNTVIGLVLLLLFQLCPYFGLYFISRPTQLRLLFSSASNPTELARGSVVTAPLLFNLVRAVFKPKGFETDKKSLIRGVRNWSILVGAVVRSPYLLITNQLGQDTILLYPLSSLPLVVLVYILQNILFSIGVIWTEEFLEEYGLRGYNPLIYYQLMELFVQIKVSPTPGDFGVHKIGLMIFIMGVCLVQDYLFTEQVVIRHTQNINSTKVVKYHPTATISTTCMIHTMVKNAIENYINLLHNPLINLLDYYTTISPTFLRIPDWVVYNMFFREDYHYYYYIQKNSVLGWSILTSLCLDCLLYLMIARKIDVIDPQFNSVTVSYELKKMGNEVAPIAGDSNPLYEKLSRLKVNSALNGVLFYIFVSLVPIYGSTLKGPQLVYYVGRLTQLPELIKNEQELPEYLKGIKSRL